MVKKAPKKEKNKFSVFYNLFYISLFPYGKKQNHLLFSPFFIIGNRNPQGKKSGTNFFFFFFFLLFSILPLRVIGEITIYLFFRNCDFKYPKMPLSALKFQFFTNYFFPAVITRTHTPSQTHSVFPTHNA